MNKLIAILFVALFAILLFGRESNTQSAQAAVPIIEHGTILIPVPYLPPMPPAPVYVMKVVPLSIARPHVERIEPVPVTIRMKVTAYCPCSICCGKNACGVAADGSKVKGKRLVAADWGILPKGTMVKVPGYGIVKVRDTGSAIKGNRLDVYFDSHQKAKIWGVQYLDVEIVPDSR